MNWYKIAKNDIDEGYLINYTLFDSSNSVAKTGSVKAFRAWDAMKILKDSLLGTQLGNSTILYIGKEKPDTRSGPVSVYTSFVYGSKLGTKSSPIGQIELRLADGGSWRPINHKSPLRGGASSIVTPQSIRDDKAREIAVKKSLDKATITDVNSLSLSLEMHKYLYEVRDSKYKLIYRGSVEAQRPAFVPDLLLKRLKGRPCGNDTIVNIKYHDLTFTRRESKARYICEVVGKNGICGSLTLVNKNFVTKEEQRYAPPTGPAPAAPAGPISQLPAPKVKIRTEAEAKAYRSRKANWARSARAQRNKDILEAGRLRDEAKRKALINAPPLISEERRAKNRAQNNAAYSRRKAEVKAKRAAEALTPPPLYQHNKAWDYILREIMYKEDNMLPLDKVMYNYSKMEKDVKIRDLENDMQWKVVPNVIKFMTYTINKAEIEKKVAQEANTEQSLNEASIWEAILNASKELKSWCDDWINKNTYTPQQAAADAEAAKRKRIEILGRLWD